MGKRLTGRRGKGVKECFVMLTHSFLAEEAWLHLSSNSKVAYVYLRKQKKNASDDEEISLTYRAKDQPLPFRSYARAKRQLIEHGFLELTELGGLEKRVSRYRFSEKWRQWKKGVRFPYV